MGLVVLANRPARGSWARRMQCASNQKQIAFAFHMWSNDHGDQFPMAISGKKGGASDSVGAGDPLHAFLIISNELNSPKILLCPADIKRGPQVAHFESLATKNISYSIG